MSDTVTDFFKPTTFKEVISWKNPLFEGINANDFEWIKIKWMRIAQEQNKNRTDMKSSIGKTQSRGREQNRGKTQSGGMENSGRTQGNSNEGIRLNKYLAQCGVCSRRDADRLIADGKVLVNGSPARVGQIVSERDVVQVGKRSLDNGGIMPHKKVVLAFYKPVGVTCTERDAHAEKTIADLIRYPVRVTYAGRLDKDSEGLLLLTNDGDLIDAMMRGANRHEKEYIVKVNKEITDASLQRMAEGMYLKELEVQTRPCETEKIGKYTFWIILTQGLNRQIRRMCKTLGYEVTHLKRVRVMNILLGDLQPGEYRELNAREYEELYFGVGLRQD